MTSSATLLRGSQTPRLWSSPEGVASKAPGEAAIRQATAAGLHLDEWQQHVLREGLGVRADGKWAAFSVCVIVPRQNGKGAILEALAMAALFQFDLEYIVWTAHQMKTAKQGFQRLWSHIRKTPDLYRQVERPRFGNDDRGIDLKDGRQIRFIARGGGSGVGFTADLVILDEAMSLGADVMADLLPTLSAVPNPQIWYTSSAPHEDSEQLHAVRRRGLAGTDPRLAFFEWSVDKDSADPRSEVAWAQANPAYPHRVDREAIEAEWNEFNADVDPRMFMRERLSVPDEPAGEFQVIAADVWNACLDKSSTIASHDQWALAVSPERDWASIGIAGRNAAGKLHVERLKLVTPAGTSWVVAKCVEIWQAKKVPIRIHKSGPESAFIVPLRERGVEVVEVSSAEFAQATGQLIDAANARDLAHIGQASLDKSLRGAALRIGGDGASMWSQRNSSVEITPLVAVTVAAGGVPAAKRKAAAWVLVD